jgi:hypothetical protein
VIKGPFDGDSRTTGIRIGKTPVRLLAESPRQAVFEPPAEIFGLQEVEVREGKSRIVREFRNVGVRVTATKLSVVPGENATVAVTLLGLAALSAPLVAILTNDSPTVVDMGGVLTQTITVAPETVLPDGTFTLEQTLTGIRAGTFSVRVGVESSDSTAVYDVGPILDKWEAGTGIAITPIARKLIRLDVESVRTTLDRLMKAQGQQSHEALFDALVRHYCFTLRDAKVVAQRDGSLMPGGSDSQTGSSDIATITLWDVLYAPFPLFLQPFDNGSPKSYIDVTSAPPLAEVRIDDERLGFTDRLAVVSAGSHSIRVELPSANLSCTKKLKLNPGTLTPISCQVPRVRRLFR